MTFRLAKTSFALLLAGLSVAALPEPARSAEPASAPAPAALRLLYVTDYNAVFHDYRAQAQRFGVWLPRRVNAAVTVVGEESETFATLRHPGFGAGYDAIVYNMCLAANGDEDMVATIIAETRDRGIPAVLLHCSMHSFQITAGRSGVLGGIHIAWPGAVQRWEAKNPGVPYPVWWKFTGLDSDRHDFARGFTVESTESGHPLVAGLPPLFALGSDELYRNLELAPGVVPLYRAHSVETNSDHVVAWAHENGGPRVFATTLGHGPDTIDLEVYQRLVARGVLWVTGHIDASGAVDEGYAGPAGAP
jgi:hypothetical protein